MTWHPKNPVVQPDGTQLWYRFRKTRFGSGIKFALHRTDGPAIIYPDGSAEWWVDGEFVRREEAER